MQLNIPKQFQQIIKKISQCAQENNYQTYAVGGFVRDLFLNRNSNDLDIMVENLSNPDDAFAGINFSKLLAKKYNLHCPVVFERFGTSKLIFDNKEIEFIMPRKEYYTDSSRNPDTKIGSLMQDALRRDFTVNALFLRLSDFEILDLTKKGLKDIENNIIRVCDEEHRNIIFAQDPLRILRAVRQSLQLGFKIEKETYRAMKEANFRIKIVSPERIRDEINKILLEKEPSKAFLMLEDIGLLKEILPDIQKLIGLKQPPKYHDDDVFVHTLKVLDRVPPVLELRLAALFHDCGKYEAYKEVDGQIKFFGHENFSVNITIDAMNRLKYSKDLIKRVGNIIKNHMFVKQHTGEISDISIRKFARRCGNELDFTLEFFKADFGKEKPDEKIFELIRRVNLLKDKKELYFNDNLLDGNEIQKIFNRPGGEWISKVKEKILELQFENPNIGKEELKKKIKQINGL